MAQVNYIDAKTDAVGETIEGVVCVVGAGAAGLTLVRRLAKTVSGVVLIESGEFEIDDATQSLYSSRMRGLPYFDLATSRLRYFGGTTNHWAGYCRAIDAIDYEARPSAGLPGWPVAQADVEPFATEAARDLGINGDFFEPVALLDGAAMDSAGLAEHSSELLKTKVYQIAKEGVIRLGPRYRDEIGASQNVRVYLNLNAAHVQLAADGGSVDHLRCATLTGKQVVVRARFFVLCCHAIENARLLLTSHDVATRGIGNQFDHVGRYFMDHTGVTASKFIPSDAFPKFYDFEVGKTRSINAVLGFADTTLRKYDLLQYTCRFEPVYAEPETAGAIERVRRGLNKPGDASFLRDVATVLADLPVVPSYVAARYNLYFAKPLYYSIEHHLEQAPNPSSRVVISNRRDALGNLIADLDWQMAEADYRSFAVGQDLLGAEMAALGWGRMVPEAITPEFVREQVFGFWHNIGTTRMSATPESGVVDSNCRVHGIANLYVGGSSVFPSAGGGAPTMMIMALALRMSDHLKHQLES